MKNEAKKRIRKPKNLTLCPVLVETIGILAAANGRSLSSYIENLMREDVASYEKYNGEIGIPKVAEFRDEYGEIIGMRLGETTVSEAANPIKKRPTRLKGSPDIQKPRKDDSGSASA